MRIVAGIDQNVVARPRNEERTMHVPWTHRLWARVHQDETGANLVEYGMLVGMIALVAVLAVTFVGNEALSNIDVGSRFP